MVGGKALGSFPAGDSAECGGGWVRSFAQDKYRHGQERGFVPHSEVAVRLGNGWQILLEMLQREQWVRSDRPVIE